MCFFADITCVWCKCMHHVSFSTCLQQQYMWGVAPPCGVVIPLWVVPHLSSPLCPPVELFSVLCWKPFFIKVCLIDPTTTILDHFVAQFLNCVLAVGRQAFPGILVEAG